MNDVERIKTIAEEELANLIDEIDEHIERLCQLRRKLHYDIGVVREVRKAVEELVGAVVVAEGYLNLLER